MKFFIGIITAIITAFLDQWSKLYAFAILDERLGEPVVVTPFFNLVKVYNYGVSFGMFNDIAYGRVILSAIAIAITIFLLVWLVKEKKTYMVIALGLIIGGAIGNIIDRVTIGAVADFLDFYVGNYHWPAFNLADTAVFIGVAIVLLDSFFEDKEEETNDK